LIAYLTAPEQMLERAAGSWSVSDSAGLLRRCQASRGRLRFLSIRRAARSRARRPARWTPIYTELSEILQIELHRALVRQAEPKDALNSAASRINNSSIEPECGS
jgi:hypothetical protein